MGVAVCLALENQLQPCHRPKHCRLRDGIDISPSISAFAVKDFHESLCPSNPAKEATCSHFDLDRFVLVSLHCIHPSLCVVVDRLPLQLLRNRRELVQRCLASRSWITLLSRIQFCIRTRIERSLKCICTPTVVFHASMTLSSRSGELRVAGDWRLEEVGILVLQSTASGLQGS